jgi:hypothetical protein
MHTYRRPEAFVRVGETDACFEVGRPFAGSDRQELRDARQARSGDGLLAIGCELVAIEVAMRVS